MPIGVKAAEYWQREIMADQDKGPTLLRKTASGASHLYEAGLDIYLAMEKIGIRRRETLPLPVISIGNLTSGGTGKTPMTRLVCSELAKKGKRLAVLSRGHGGKGSGVRLVSDVRGNIASTASDAGDEPLLLAESLPGIPVLVGKDRRQSGREAMRRFPLDLIVLDDGLQYWQLHRNLDIVLIDSQRPFDNGYCLPRGLLREPVRHISRAGIVVATRSDKLSEEDKTALREQIAHFSPQSSLYFAQHKATGYLQVLGQNKTVQPLNTLEGKRVVAWSAIAQPSSFENSLTNAGATVLSHIVEADHYTPTLEDSTQVEKLRQELSADAIVITEKDAVKWPNNAAKTDKLFALRIEMHVESHDDFIADIWSRVFPEEKL